MPSPSRIRLRLGLVAALASAAACAPVSFAYPGGMGVSIGPSFSPSISSCSLLGSSSLASRLGLTTPSISIGEMRNRVAAIQAESMFSANAPGSEMRGWKQVASGECW
jgi:hypothetical protein